MIEIIGLKVNACHGVLNEEKVVPQPFVFDIKIDCDLNKAAQSDDVNDTVNYAEVCSEVTEFCKAHSFNLIEKLARETAWTLIGKYASARSITVTVHKPQAPVGLPFSDVCVTYTTERNEVVLSLGSNLGDKKATLDSAIEKLSAINGVKVKKVSDYLKTEPYGGVATGEFLNCAVLIDCLLTPRELLNEIHGIEEKHGRVRTVRWGDRTLDIDIIFFGNKIIAESGLCVPHPDYFNRNFVLEPIKQIVPDYVCPKLLKRVRDL